MTQPRVAPRYDRLQPASPAASRAKRCNRARGTAAELRLRRKLWALGLRYRLHAKNLPGKPDIVFRRQRVTVFVDGDFWHGRKWEARQKSLSKGHNAGYWLAKVAYNRERDRRITDLLTKTGWRVIRLWETDVIRRTDEMAEIVTEALLERCEEARRGRSCGSLF